MVIGLKSTKFRLPLVCRDPAYENQLQGATGVSRANIRGLV